MIPLLLQDETRLATKSDGLKLSRNSTFADELYRFLTSKEPLQACQYCLGSVGRRIRATQRSSSDPITPFSTEALIDWKYLKYYELVGNPRLPSWLQSIGAPVKRTLLMKVRSIRLGGEKGGTSEREIN